MLSVRQGLELALLGLACAAPTIASLLSGKTLGLPTFMDVGGVLDRKASPEAYWAAFAVWAVVGVFMFCGFGAAIAAGII